MTAKSSRGTDKFGNRVEIIATSQLGQGIGGGAAAPGEPPAPAGVSAGASTFADSEDFVGKTRTVSQAYVAPATLVLSKPVSMEYLIVGGGGGGGRGFWGGGGGGAGGFRTNPNALTTFPAGTYTITIGAGGTGSAPTEPDSNRGTSGGDTSISGNVTFTAAGGGGGGNNGQNGASGGSGGGAGGNNPRDQGGYQSFGGSGNSPPVSPPQGNPGGPNPGGPSGGFTGTGGGAGGAGISADGGGGPGAGVDWVPPGYGTPGPDGTLRYFAGGGGGGNNRSRPGGSGGGGAGGSSGAQSGMTNSGGGGGAIASSNGSHVAAPGGPGILFLRFTYSTE